MTFATVILNAFEKKIIIFKTILKIITYYEDNFFYRAVSILNVN